MKVTVVRNVCFVLRIGDGGKVDLATPEQQRAYELDKGEPVYEIHRADGTVELYIGRDTCFIGEQPGIGPDIRFFEELPGVFQRPAKPRRRTRG
jgi:hypothetical protein